MIREIVLHPTWFIMDSSKLAQYMTCPRRFFFEYILGWRTDSPVIYFEWGKGWHAAMDYLVHNGCTPANLDAAYDAFLNIFRQSYGVGEDCDMGARTADNARNALELYIQTYQHVDDWTPLHVEIPGEVSIGDNKALIMRLDLLVENEMGLVTVVDHKHTTGETATWSSQWALSIQLGTYLHCCYSLYGWDKVYGAIINGAIIRKPIQLKKDGTPYANSKGTSFVRIPVVKTQDQMQQWLDTVMWYYDSQLDDLEALDNADPDAPTMRCYPQNPTACIKYNSVCPYHSYCCMRGNPLQIVQQYEGKPPIGMKVEYWDPRNHDNAVVEG